MAESKHIVHSIPPTYDENSRVLMLGSLPSPKSRETGYNYGHPQNRFWNVLATLADEPTPTTNERKRDFCLRHHIALWDVVGECDIEGASDASIRNPKPNPLSRITESAPIETVFCTGAKSHQLYGKLCEAEVGMPAVKLPSTSPANAACSMDQLLDAYAQVFQHTHEFEPPVLDVPAVVELEQSIAASGTPLSELMNRAGTALARRIEAVVAQIESGSLERPLRPLDGGADALPRPSEDDASQHGAIAPNAREAQRPLTVLLCGNGNNGGDGWVAAEKLSHSGLPVCVVTVREPDAITAQPAHDAAVEAAQSLASLGGSTVHAGDEAAVDGSPLTLVDPSPCQLQAIMDHACVVVDCILGTGASGRSPKEPFASWIRMANDARTHAAVIAADAPSGVSAQDDQTVEPHIVADETVTMIVPKPGLRAPECGRIHVAPLAYIEPHLKQMQVQESR